MMWRLLARRCPVKSMTVVGDVAQTGSVTGTDTWAQALDPFAEGRWELAELSVNYRTPARNHGRRRGCAGVVRAGSAAAEFGS